MREMNSSERLSVVFIWHTLSPYLIARMDSLGKQPAINLVVIEVNARAIGREWEVQRKAEDFKLITLFEDYKHNTSYVDMYNQLSNTLTASVPDVIFLPSWYEPCSWMALRWAKKNNKPCAVFVESTEIDYPRSFLRELPKKYFLKQMEGAIVAGPKSAEYVQKLGMEPGRICIVGNVVNNELFSSECKSSREDPNKNCPLQFPTYKYFLYVGRFSPEKNLLTLLDAYQLYREYKSEDHWALVLVGGGASEKELKNYKINLKIEDVHFIPFQQLPSLINYYAFAGAFILPSTREPWGLVVNEAMLCGLPVIVSRNCGCASALVVDGVNGYTFDPNNSKELAELMIKIYNGALDQKKVEAFSQERMSIFSPEAYGFRVAECARVMKNRQGFRFREFSLKL